jgi:predicted HAD superfamily Cof-like phosphohydrolase
MSPDFFSPSEPVHLVAQMHQQFGLAYEGPPRHLDNSEFNFRLGCLREELDEFNEALLLADQFDALLDLMVFTIGTMLRMGLPIDEGFRRVMAANCQKQLAATQADSKRGFALDLVKPAGWKAPDLTDLTDLTGD